MTYDWYIYKLEEYTFLNHTQNFILKSPDNV